MSGIVQYAARVWHALPLSPEVREGFNRVFNKVSVAQLATALVWLLVIWGGLNALPELAFDVGYYTSGTVAAHYHVAWAILENKPHDCEFDSVPYGEKHCYYKANFSVNRAESSAALYWNKVDD